jgi:signal transduction histidine kinase
VSTWRESWWGQPAIRASGPESGAFGRRYAWVQALLPYLLLAAATLVSQFQPYPAVRDRLTVLGLAAVALAWVALLRTPVCRPGPTGLMLLYFAGFIALAWQLEARSSFFIAFTCLGFYQAFLLLPSIPAFLAVAATSSTIYLAPAGSGLANPGALPGLILIIAFQTALVGGGGVVGAQVTREREERQRLFDELESAQQENAGLHAQLLTQAREAGVLDERQRLAREIHDTMAQGLTGIVTQLEAAEAAGAPEQWRPHVARASALARDSLREARRALQAWSPEPLEGSRLPDAIAEMARRWGESTPVALTFETSGRPVQLLTDLEVTLFRVAQEALANVARHASASRVGLTLSYTDDVVLLDARDDGAGFTPGATRGFGLRAMRQRLRLVGGRLEIESAPGAGTAVSASVPAIPAGGGD